MGGGSTGLRGSAGTVPGGSGAIGSKAGAGCAEAAASGNRLAAASAKVFQAIVTCLPRLFRLLPEAPLWAFHFLHRMNAASQYWNGETCQKIYCQPILKHLWLWFVIE